MAAIARRLATVSAERRRRFEAADKSPSLSSAWLVALLCLFGAASLPCSHAVLCACNAQHALSDCRFEGWTCTISTAVGGCFTRMKLLENGSITRDVGCVHLKWNPTFCNEGRTTETYAVECCDDRDRCNDHLTPSFLPPSIPPTPSPAPTLGTYLPPSVVIQDRTAQDVGSGAPSALQPGPTPSSSPVENPPDLLRCTCRQSNCKKEHCLSNYKCVKELKYDSVTGQTTTRLGCLNTNGHSLGVCNGTLDNSHFKLRCCDGRDRCNEDLNVTLDIDDPSSLTPTPDNGTAEPTDNSTDVTITPSVSTGGDDNKLKCACSLSLCRQRWCLTNYKCFQELYIQPTFYETRLGCMESISEVNLDVIGVCSGALDRENYKIRCCDSAEMCNLHLDVRPGDSGSNPSVEPSPVVQGPAANQRGKDNNEQVYLNLSIAVVSVTVIVTTVVMSVLVGVFYLRYRREKAKVTSVDQFTPSSIKQLSNSSITCTVIPSHQTKTDHTDYV